MYSFCVGFEKSQCIVQCRVCVGFETPQCIVQCRVCVGFAPQTIHIVTCGKSDGCRVLCRVCV